MTDFIIRFDVETNLVGDPHDPHQFVIPIHGRVLRVGDDEKRRVIGRVSISWVRIGEAQEKGCPLESVFDCIDQTLANSYAEIFDSESGTLDDSLAHDGYFGNGSDLLMIEKVEVLPKYRRKDLGLKIVHRTLETFRGGMAAALLEAHPLRNASDDSPNWPEKMKLEGFEGQREQGIQKLRKHWGRLGFQQVRDTHFFLFDLARQIPKIKSRQAP